MFWVKFMFWFLVAWKIFWYWMYRVSIADDNYRHYAKMKWSMIKKLYPINPDKWTCDDNPYSTRRFDSPSDKLMLNLRYNKIPIMLSFIDYQKLRFHFYRRGHTKNVVALEGILEDVQMDIEKKKEEAERQLKEAEQMMKGVGSHGQNH